jgi:hypothetical protein
MAVGVTAPPRYVVFLSGYFQGDVRAVAALTQ